MKTYTKADYIRMEQVHRKVGAQIARKMSNLLTTEEVDTIAAAQKAADEAAMKLRELTLCAAEDCIERYIKDRTKS